MHADLTYAQCGGPCPVPNSPVCAENAQGEFRRFPNQCDLNTHNCENPKERKFLLYKACLIHV